MPNEHVESLLIAGVRKPAQLRTRAPHKNELDARPDLRRFSDAAATAQRTIENIFETGRVLMAAKASLPHGQFQRMTEVAVQFDRKDEPERSA